MTLAKSPITDSQLTDRILDLLAVRSRNVFELQGGLHTCIPSLRIKTVLRDLERGGRVELVLDPVQPLRGPRRYVWRLFDPAATLADSRPIRSR